MLGFLGTVTGMVNAFYSMAAAGEAADITTLSSGIYEALVYYGSRSGSGHHSHVCLQLSGSRVNTVVNQLEASTMEFMDLLKRAGQQEIE